MKNLHVLTVALLMGVCSAAVAGKKTETTTTEKWHTNRHNRRHANDAKGGEMKRTKKMKKESKSSNGEVTRRRSSKVEKYS